MSEHMQRGGREVAAQEILVILEMGQSRAEIGFEIS